MSTTTPVTDRTKRIRLDLTPEEQQRLRIVAAELGLSMSAYVRDLVLTAIDVSDPRNGKKTSKKS